MVHLELNMDEAQEMFFADTAMLGITSSTQAHKLCWMFNRQLGTQFQNVPENMLEMSDDGKPPTRKSSKQKTAALPIQSLFDEVSPIKTSNSVFFPVYNYAVPNSSAMHTLFKLKSGDRVLLPEIRHMDYLWLVQSSLPGHDASILLRHIRGIQAVQLAQIIDPELLKKSMINLMF